MAHTSQNSEDEIVINAGRTDDPEKRAASRSRLRDHDDQQVNDSAEDVDSDEESEKSEDFSESEEPEDSEYSEESEDDVDQDFEEEDSEDMVEEDEDASAADDEYDEYDDEESDADDDAYDEDVENEESEENDLDFYDDEDDDEFDDEEDEESEVPQIPAANIVSTHEFSGTRVVGGKKGNSRIGKVDRFVFHPTERRCIGFMVKRPDLALMFHRKPLFVTLDGFRMEDGRVRIEYNDPDHQGESACKRLGVDFDKCVLWEGMPLVSVSGVDIGYAGNIQFDRHTGNVVSITVDSGATKRMLLGDKNIPANMIRGFRTGIGCEIATMGHEGRQEDNAPLGAILISDRALEVKTEGGLAEKAGRSSARLNAKIHEASKKAQPTVQEVSHNAKGEMNAAAYATGRQIGRTKGMFENFKKEYDKAVTGKGTYQEKDYAYLDEDSDNPRGKGMFTQFKENFDKALNSDDDDEDESEDKD